MPGKKESEEQRREQIVRAAFAVATRERLNQLTIRQVAAEAGLSTGLIFFHFKSKDALLVALLEWLLDQLFEFWEAPGEMSPKERLLALVHRDLSDAYQDEQSAAKLELFLAYWTMGLREPAIKERIQQGVERSRQVFLPTVHDVIASEPERFQGVTAQGLVTVLVGIVEGCALQSLLSDERVDVEQILTVLRALLESPGGVTASKGR
ncbi:MAG TPA: TetR/AcrR family transcriptional regulator [Ktedonobacteraceae bacterium]|jgi:TetR/AcrR family transcriptional repressor of bet genes